MGAGTGAVGISGATTALSTTPAERELGLATDATNHPMTVTHRTMPTFPLRSLLLLGFALPLSAQPTLRTLARPEAIFPESFTQVSGLRELADGRVVLSDTRDRVLQALDFRTGEMTPVGRAGSGPAEWGVPSRLYAMPGDSTLMLDFQNGRFLIILPDGKPGPTFRIPETSPAAFGTLIGVDSRGRIIVERARVDRESPLAGSLGVVDLLRYDRAASRTDTLAQRAEARGEHAGARQLPGGMLQTFTNLPLAPRDLALVAPDGRVVILRADPYRMESIALDGARFVGPVAAASAVRITAEERRAFIRSQVRPGTIVVSGGAGAGVMPRAGGAAGRGAVAIDAAVSDALSNPDMVWPDRKPPFIGNTAHAAPDGRVWVLRSRAHDDPVPTYDVFERDGRVLTRVALPPLTRVAGFGRGVVYLVRTDEDDLQHIERHRLP